MKSKKPKLITKNKKAYFDYEILDTIEAGIILTGAEIKAIRENRINLKGGYITILNEETLLEHIHIGQYSHAHNPDYDPKRKRKLLLTKKEIRKLALQSDKKGITIIPLEVIIKNNFAKIIIGLGRGKKKYDKRELLKKKGQEMEIKRSLKHHVSSCRPRSEGP